MPFNNSQKKAINHNEGPALVLAGPGSGKTTVITHRTKKLIEYDNVRPENILVITFTKAAAMEMQERFYSLMNKKGNAVTFGTFHSVFFRILKYAYHYDASNIASEEKRREILKEVIEELSLDMEDESEFINGILSEISVIKNDRISLERYYAKNCSEEKFQAIYRLYESKMRRADQIDFDDMLLMTYELLYARRDILKLWQDKYRYILIDEFQDINKIQYDTIRLLAQPRNNLFIVGDDDQSVYRFRGARPEIMLGFEKDYPDAVKILLDTNYRSSQTIVSAAGRLIVHNHFRFKKNIRAVHEAGPEIFSETCRDASEESEKMIADIHRHYEQKTAYTDMAVLVRTNTGARAIVEKLIDYNIPFQVRDQIPNLFEHWIAKHIFTYLSIAYGDDSRGAFLRIINKPKRYIHREALSEQNITMDLLREYYKEKDWMTDRIDRMEYDFKMLRIMAPYAAVNYIRHGINYESYILEFARERRTKPEELLEVLDALQESAKEFKTVQEWIDHIQDYSAQLKEKARKQDTKKGVQISTMHSSKGLEYEVVFIPDVNEEVVPHNKAVLEADLEEERRLFYVAMTRAKKYLYLYSLKERYNKPMRSSRYLEELNLYPAESKRQANQEQEDTYENNINKTRRSGLRKR